MSTRVVLDVFLVVVDDDDTYVVTPNPRLFEPALSSFNASS
jgi:hypothetical protein